MIQKNLYDISHRYYLGVNSGEFSIGKVYQLTNFGEFTIVLQQTHNNTFLLGTYY